MAIQTTQRAKVIGWLECRISEVRSAHVGRAWMRYFPEYLVAPLSDAFGPKRTWPIAMHMSGFGGKADTGYPKTTSHKWPVMCSSDRPGQWLTGSVNDKRPTDTP